MQDAAEYAASDLPDEIAIRGRGGTDFRPGFAWLEENDIRPGVCLYFTDMLCSSYPGYRTSILRRHLVSTTGSPARRLEPRALGRAHRYRNLFGKATP